MNTMTPATALLERMTDPRAAGLPRVAWTRGDGCLPLADMLSGGSPIAVGRDLARTCIDQRVDWLVTRRLTGFDLVSQIVPRGVDLDRVRSITVAVGDGPHAPLAAAVAERLSQALGVPAELATVYREIDEMPAAIARIERLSRLHPNLGRRVAHAKSAVGLLDTLDRFNLLVVGAPEGSWFQRQLVGPGQTLADSAPGGAIVVRSAPERCFHASADAAGHAIGPELQVAEARRLVSTPAAPVARNGRLIGLVRERTLASAPDDATVAEVMEAAVAVRPTEPLAAVQELDSFFESSPVPVVDDGSRLVGVVPRSGSVPRFPEEVAS